MKWINSIKRHPLMDVLITSKGNTKTLLLSEPLIGIPFELLAPFVTLYMFAQGISEVQIGIILSTTMVGQVFFSFFGGIIADKLGRKKATIISESVGWGLACFVWTISNNFWLFMIAVLLNSSDRIAMNSWQCMIVEDADQKKMLGIYTWVNIASLVAVFFAPIAGILIEAYSLVPVIRGIYLFFGINMVIKFFITLRLCTETTQGKIRIEETRSVPVKTLVLEYSNQVLPKIFRSSATVKIVLISAILHITTMIRNSFFGIYVTTKLDVAEGYLAFFPILNAVVMLIFMFGVQHKMEQVKDKIPLWIGLSVFAICKLMLILIPSGNMLLIVLYLLFIAISNALVTPRAQAMMQIAIDPHERARIMAIVMACTIAFAAPFGFFAGFLSSLDRRLPFVFAALLFVIAMVIVGRIKDEEFSTKSE